MADALMWLLLAGMVLLAFVLVVLGVMVIVDVLGFVDWDDYRKRRKFKRDLDRFGRMDGAR